MLKIKDLYEEGLNANANAGAPNAPVRCAALRKTCATIRKGYRRMPDASKGGLFYHLFLIILFTYALSDRVWEFLKELGVFLRSWWIMVLVGAYLKTYISNKMRAFRRYSKAGSREVGFDPRFDPGGSWFDPKI